MVRFVICIVALLLISAKQPNTSNRVPLMTLDGLEKRLAHGGDTTFVVNLWATWCAPCVAEMPYFEQLQENYQSDLLKVLFVSLDAPKNLSNVVKFVQDKGLKNEVVLLDEKDEQYYIDKISSEWSGAIPATLFVNVNKDIRVFKGQEFNYEQLENNYLSIVHQQKREP